MIDFGLVLARFLHYAATTTLAGAAFFPLYAGAAAQSEALKNWKLRLLLPAAILALISGGLWFLFSAASMSGELSDMTDPDVLLAILHATSFGTVWAWRMLLALIVVFVIAGGSVPPVSFGQNVVVSILAAALLGSLAGVGHTQVEEGWEGAVHVLSDAVHLLAAGAWLGGLVPLGFILARYGKDADEAECVDRVLMRFSGMGYVAVSTLVGTGLINSWFLVGSVSNLFGQRYGQILLLKLLFFVGMLTLAVANRFWLVPGLSRAASPSTVDADAALLRRRLRSHVLAEQLLGLAVLAVVSLLGTMQPAAGQ